MKSWLPKLFSRPGTVSNKKRKPARGRFDVERLEDRLTPATLTEFNGGAGLLIALDVFGENFSAVSNGATYSFTSDAPFLDGGVTDAPTDFSSFGGLTLDLSASGLARYSEVQIQDIGGGNSVTFNDSGAQSYTDDFNIHFVGFGSTITFNGATTVDPANVLTLFSSSLSQGTVAVSAGAVLTSAAGIDIPNAATLAGSGTIDGPVNALAGSAVAPGASPGILSTGDLTLAAGSVFSVEVDGATPGTEHDQLLVTGTVDLGGAILVTTGTIVSNPVGQSVVLISNDGSDAIVNTFAGLAEGAEVTINGVVFNITYAGGLDSNDVVLNQLVAVFTISNATLSEDGGTMTFTVSLSHAIGTDATVNVSFADVSTGAGDFDHTTQQVTFPANDNTSLIVSVTVTDDRFVEAQESFLVSLALDAATPLTGRLTDLTDTDTGTINENDSATVTLSGTAATTETGAAGSLTATLTLSTTGVGAISLETPITGITLAGNVDYSSDSKSFGVGALDGASVTLMVMATDDRLVEGAESLVAALTAPTSSATVGTAGAGTVNVADNDTATLTLSGTAAATEGGVTGLLTVTLALTTSGAGAIALDTPITGITLTGNVDFSSNSQSFIVGALNGDTVSLTVTATNDRFVEGLESLATATLAAPASNATVGTAGSGTVNVTDNDTATIAFTAATSNAAEGTNPHTALARLTISASGAGTVALAQDVSVAVSDAAVSAATPADYTLTTTSITFASGSGNGALQAIDVAIVDDGSVEGNETFTLTLGAVTDGTGGQVTLGAQTTNAVTITDNEVATVSIAGTTHGDETGLVSAVFTVTLAAASSTDTVLSYSVGGTATSGSDFTAPPILSVTIVMNTTTALITVPVTNDTVVEGTETLTITLSAITSGAAGITIDLANNLASRNIIDNDSASLAIATTATVSEQGGPQSKSVTLTITANGVGTPSLATTLSASVTDAGGGTAVSGVDYATFGTQTVTFLAGDYAAGTATQNFTVTPLDDILFEGDKSVNLALGSPNTTLNGQASLGNSANATTITEDDTAAARRFHAAVAGDYTLQLNGAGDTEQIFRGGAVVGGVLVGGTLVASAPVGAYSLEVFSNAGGNKLTVLFATIGASLANPIPSTGLTFTGANAGDTLVLNKGTFIGVGQKFDKVTHRYDDKTVLAGARGAVILDPSGGGTSTINYTGLKPITDNLLADDRVFNFTGGAETVTLTNSGGADGKMTIDSTLGETTTFDNPTVSMTLSVATGADVVLLNSVDPAFAAAVKLTGSGLDTFQFTNVNVFPSTTNLDVAGAVLDLNGHDQSVNAFNADVASKVTNNANGTSATLTVGSSNGTGTVSGVIQDHSAGGTGKVGLTKNGTGTLTLTGANTYTGKTTINNGVVAIAAQNGIGGNPAAFTADQLTFNGGTLNATAPFNLDDANRGVTLLAGGGTLDVSPAMVLTVADVITGAGNLTKIGTGTLVLSGANTYTGKTIINVGTVSVGAENNLGGNPVAEVADQLTLNGGVLQTTAGFSISNNRGVTLGAGNGTINVAPGTTLTINSKLVGAGGLTKQFTGTLELTAANTYAGVTNINSGTLAVTGSLESAAAVVNVNTAGVALTGGTNFAKTRKVLRPVVVTVGSTISNIALIDAPDGASGVTVTAAAGSLTRITTTTISGNKVAANGAGLNMVTGNVTLDGSTISKNEANGNTAISGNGGGVFVAAGNTLNLMNATISSNKADRDGGGLAVAAGATVNMVNTTIAKNLADSDNNAVGDGGGVSSAGLVNLKNTIIAQNNRSTAATLSNLAGLMANFARQNNNLLGVNAFFAEAGAELVRPDADVLLAPLANYGGPTETHALLPGSPALDAAAAPNDPFDIDGDANVAENVPLDQRGTGFDRLHTTDFDIGAVESFGFTVTPPVGGKFRTLVTKTFRQTDGSTDQAFSFTVKSNDPNNLEPLSVAGAQGVVSFSASTGAAGDTGAVTTPNVLLAVVANNATVAFSTTVTANNRKSNAGGSYALTASAGGNNKSNVSLFNQVVAKLSYSGDPSSTRSGSPIQFGGSTTLDITMLDQDVPRAPVVIDGQKIVVHAANGPGQLDSGAPIMFEPGQVNEVLAAGVMSQTSGNGVVRFSNLQINKSSYFTNYRIQADFVNPDIAATIADGASANFTVFPYQFEIDKTKSGFGIANVGIGAAIGFGTIVAKGSKGVVRIKVPLSVAIGLSSNILVKVLDFAGTTVVGGIAVAQTSPATSYDGPVNLRALPHDPLDPNNPAKNSFWSQDPTGPIDPLPKATRSDNKKSIQAMVKLGAGTVTITGLFLTAPGTKAEVQAEYDPSIIISGVTPNKPAPNPNVLPSIKLTNGLFLSSRYRKK